MVSVPQILTLITSVMFNSANTYFQQVFQLLTSKEKSYLSTLTVLTSTSVFAGQRTATSTPY